ncbi:MAG: hypothetical protein HY609_03465 [Deltaproteobacteria bacterium]|nr:hypothetical protein [Deltaproteobacteria bacterium]MBI4223968.1 hypothetical protein [Deltaproteobacteria bacterium]
MKEKAKRSQLQIRVSADQKRAIRRGAQQANMGMSEWILAKLLPRPANEFQQLAKKLKSDRERSYILAAIHDLFQAATADEFHQMVAQPPDVSLPPYWENYLAAMVEYAAHRKGLATPFWTREIRPLEEPAFGSDLGPLRLYLLTHSPIPFRCRNIYIDATVGQRV